MKEINFSASACRYCGFYQPEGRRGGSCRMLSVPVESDWEACTLAIPPFKTTLKKLEDMFHMPTSIPLQSPKVTKPKKIYIEDNPLSLPTTNLSSE